MAMELELLLQAERLLAERLGRGWIVRRSDDVPFVRELDFQPDAVLSIAAPDGNSIQQRVEAKQRAFPRDVAAWLDMLGPVSRQADYLFVAPYLSPGARALLEEASVNYIDMTGNMLVRSNRPSIFIRQQGAGRDPERNEVARSLRGAKAARVVRALCDFVPPFSSQTVAANAGASAGYVSKLVSLLEQEALVEREGKGPNRLITNVKWLNLIRRWTTDYRLTESNGCRLFLAPQGLLAFLSALEGMASQTGRRYAVTGSFAAAQRAAVASSSLLFCYAESPSEIAERAALVEATTAGNVYLCEPLDPVAFERSWIESNVRYAALAQVAADCLTGPDRMPSEGDALLEWMEANERLWRVDA